MANMLVVYYSSWGHVEQMAYAQAEGVAKVEGMKVVVKRVAELVPPDIARQFNFKLDQPAPVADPGELGDYDGILFGTPTRFGNMCAQMRNFLDQTGPLWAKNALLGKVAKRLHLHSEPAWRAGNYDYVLPHDATASRDDHRGPAVHGAWHHDPEGGDRRYALWREQHYRSRRGVADADRTRARDVPVPGRTRRVHRARPRRRPRGREAMNPELTGKTQAAGRDEATPFRFYDNRQKYLAFVNTCNEKSAVAQRAAIELRHVRPTPPALRIFDAGMGDATVLSRIMRHAHAQVPTVPLMVVAKEISLEDVRLGLEKMPDRFLEHPPTVLVITNLNYSEAPRLMPRDIHSAAALNWHEVRLKGQTSHDYAAQIEELATTLAFGWQTKPSPKTGNPVYVRPSVLVVYREDHKFLLDRVIPKPGQTFESYDLIIASQPWRARMSAKFKAEKVLAPLSRSLAPNGRLLIIQSYGRDPALEIVQKLWPDENPFKVDRRQLLAALKTELGREASEFNLAAPADDKAIFRYEMHTLPNEIGDRIGTSTLFAAWNAAIYVNQIEEERLDEVVTTGAYLDATQSVLQKHGGLWFNDETFVVTRRQK